MSLFSRRTDGCTFCKYEQMVDVMAPPQSVICLLPIDSEIAAPTEMGPGAKHSVRLLLSLSRCVSASGSGRPSGRFAGPHGSRRERPV